MSEHGCGHTLVTGWVLIVEAVDGKIYERYLVAQEERTELTSRGWCEAGRKECVTDTSLTDVWDALFDGEFLQAQGQEKIALGQTSDPRAKEAV